MRPGLSALSLTIALSVICTAAHGQARAEVSGTVELPGMGPARFVTVALEARASSWTLTGCISSRRGSCRRRQRIRLDPAARRELEARIAAVEAMPRCEPEAFAPNDPMYRLTVNGHEWPGHLPREVAPPAARDPGECGAPAQLAAWLANTMLVSSNAASRPR